MSDSVRPHRQQPTRLPVPGILQARTLEWVAISFSNAWKWKVKVKSLRLLATPWTAAHQAPPSMGFSRQEYWSGVPLPSPNNDMSSKLIGNIKNDTRNSPCRMQFFTNDSLKIPLQHFSLFTKLFHWIFAAFPWVLLYTTPLPTIYLKKYTHTHTHICILVIILGCFFSFLLATVMSIINQDDNNINNNYNNPSELVYFHRLNLFFHYLGWGGMREIGEGDEEVKNPSYKINES